jgi:hypothetical protein
MRQKLPADLSLQARTLWRAADYSGGLYALASTLQVPAMELEEWLMGDQDVPQPVFHAALDYVIAKQGLS